MKQVGMALVGAGGWGAMHARTYTAAPNAALVAVTDKDPARAEAMAAQFGAKAYPTLEAMLADPNVDAVAIVTPDFAHDEPALAAAKAGKHLLIEKPLSMTVAGCEAILAAAKTSGVHVMVDFHARWSPPIYKAWESVQKGQVGAPKHVYYRLNDRIFVPTEMLPWANQSSVLWFVGSHAIDTVRWLVGDEVVRVYARAGRGVLTGMGIDTADYYLSTLEFANGATAVIENSWILPNTMPNIVDVKCELVGTEGALYVDQSHNRALEKYTHEGGEYPDVFVLPTIYGRQMGFAAESIQHFIDSIAGGEAPRVTGNDGLVVTKIICAIEESVASGQPVDIR